MCVEAELTAVGRGEKKTHGLFFSNLFALFFRNLGVELQKRDYPICTLFYTKRDPFDTYSFDKFIFMIEPIKAGVSTAYVQSRRSLQASHAYGCNNVIHIYIRPPWPSCCFLLYASCVPLIYEDQVVRKLNLSDSESLKNLYLSND